MRFKATVAEVDPLPVVTGGMTVNVVNEEAVGAEEVTADVEVSLVFSFRNSLLTMI